MLGLSCQLVGRRESKLAPIFVTGVEETWGYPEGHPRLPLKSESRVSFLVMLRKRRGLQQGYMGISWNTGNLHSCL